MSPQTATPTGDDAQINGERYHTYSDGSPISVSRVAGIINQSKASDDRTIYSPIEEKNVLRTTRHD